MAVPLRSRLRSEDRRGGAQLLGSSVVEPLAEGPGICDDERPAVRPQDLPGGSFLTDSGCGAGQSSPSGGRAGRHRRPSHDTPAQSADRPQERHSGALPDTTQHTMTDDVLAGETATPDPTWAAIPGSAVRRLPLRGESARAPGTAAMVAGLRRACGARPQAIARSGRRA
jgi:hypothetical protein